MSTRTTDVAASDRWLDIDEYAGLLGISRWSLRDMVTARRVHFRRVGKHVRFSPKDIEENAAMWKEAPQEPAKVIDIGSGARRRAGRRRSA